MPPTLTQTPADILAYQNEMIRTKQYIARGRMYKITIGPSNGWPPPNFQPDPFVAKFGRLIDFRHRLTPFAEALDSTQLLITAPFRHRDGTVGLPDVPMPDWHPEPWTPEESGYTADGKPLNERYPGQPADWTPEKALGLTQQERIAQTNLRDRKKDEAPMIPQNLLDRCEYSANGRPILLDNTNFLVFQPVLQIVFQPEVNLEMQAAYWTAECQYDQATDTHVTLLVDRITGEAHFYGGRYDIVRPE